jgi:hypothetical protein
MQPAAAAPNIQVATRDLQERLLHAITNHFSH